MPGIRTPAGRPRVAAEDAEQELPVLAVRRRLLVLHQYGDLAHHRRHELRERVERVHDHRLELLGRRRTSDPVALSSRNQPRSASGESKSRRRTAGPRRQQRDDEQRHRDEAAEAHRSHRRRCRPATGRRACCRRRPPTAPGRPRPWRARRGCPEPAQHLGLDEEHQLERDLEQDRRQQREGEALADHRREVLDGQVEHDDVDEHVDHVGRPVAQPATHRATPLRVRHGVILTHGRGPGSVAGAHVTPQANLAQAVCSTT